MNPVTESEVRAACLPNPARASRPTLRQAPPELPVSDILAEIERIADLPLPQATTLPPQAYMSALTSSINVLENIGLPARLVDALVAWGDEDAVRHIIRRQLSHPGGKRV